MARQCVFILAWSLILATALFSGSTHAFTSNFHQRAPVVSVSASTSKATKIFSTPPENEEEQGLDAFADPLTANKPPVPDSTPEGTSYPIDAPSPILLASSMVLAIIGVGKQKLIHVFQRSTKETHWMCYEYDCTVCFVFQIKSHDVLFYYFRQRTYESKTNKKGVALIFLQTNHAFHLWSTQPFQLEVSLSVLACFTPVF